MSHAATAPISAGCRRSDGAAFGLLTLTHAINVPGMSGLELVTGSGVALFWPASTALLPKIVPQDELQSANVLSRRVMNGA